MMVKLIFFIVCVGFLLSACTPRYQINQSISEYESVKNQINLGDSRTKVLKIIEPTQKDLKSSWQKSPEKYIKNEVLVEIYFARSALQSDGLTTDDEFTPYVFNNGKLVAIGWTAIGGAKSQGQTTPRTNISIQQNTIVY